MTSFNDISSEYRTIAWSYLPCSHTGRSHDLHCGHRVQTEAMSQCGSNCAHPSNPTAMPFICRVCIAQPILEGLGMLSISSTSEAWEPHPLEFTELTSGIVGALIEDEVLSLIHKGYRDAAPVAKTNGLSDFVREFGTKVLKIGEADVVMMENMFRGLEIKTEEDKMRAMESLFSALGLA